MTQPLIRFAELAASAPAPAPDTIEALWARFDGAFPAADFPEAIAQFRSEYVQRIGARLFTYVGKLEMPSPPEYGGAEHLLQTLGVTRREYAGSFTCDRMLQAALYAVPRWPGYYVLVRGVRWGLLQPKSDVSVFVFKDATKASEVQQ